MKVGPTVQLASPDEERRLAERRRAGDLPFDLRPTHGATLTELDRDYFCTQYLPHAVAPDVLDQNQRSVKQQFMALRLATTGDNPTNGGILAVGKDPQRWVPGAWGQFVRFDGPSLTGPIRDQKELTGRVEDVLRRMDELVETNVSVRTDVTSATRETRSPDYPVVALKQLIRNAVMHRSYDGTNAPVRVYWYSDRIEIQSPGGLYGRVTPQNFGQGVTDYRNPVIAEAMHHLGFAQRFGLGIPLAREVLSQNGNPPPEFAFQPTSVGVTLWAAP